MEDGRDAPDAAAPRAGAEGELRGLLAALTVRDLHDPARAERLAAFARRVAERVGVGAAEARDVEQLARLHEVGKLALPEALLAKTGELTTAEREALCQHPEIGARIVGSLSGLAPLAPLMRAQCERWDGLGYPRGLRGDEIPLGSRIVFACDAYLAMISERPYRPAIAPQVAAAAVAQNAGTQFCPTTAQALLDVLSAEGVVPEPPPPAPGPPRALRSAGSELRSKWAQAGLLDAAAPAEVELDAAAPAATDVLDAAAPAEVELDAAAPAATDLLDAAAPAEIEAVPAHPRRAVPPTAHPRQWVHSGPRRRSPLARRRDTVALAGGAIVGLLWALPLADVRARCPAAGEGLNLCQLQKAWAPGATKLAAATIGMLLLSRLLIERLPEVYGRWRRGELRRRHVPPDFASDPVLVAANWGLTYTDAHPGRGRLRRRTWRSGLEAEEDSSKDEDDLHPPSARSTASSQEV